MYIFLKRDNQNHSNITGDKITGCNIIGCNITGCNIILGYAFLMLICNRRLPCLSYQVIMIIQCCDITDYNISDYNITITIPDKRLFLTFQVIIPDYLKWIGHDFTLSSQQTRKQNRQQDRLQLQKQSKLENIGVITLYLVSR